MISIIIPVYNEQKNLEELNNRLLSVCSSLNKKFEIIFVDDGSTDSSLEKIKNFSKINSNIFYIEFFRNFGQHAAVMAGFSNAKGEIVITLDADLQNPPEEIKKLLDEIDKGYDIRVGNFPFSALGKTLAEGSRDGFIKIIYDKKYGELLGCHMIGKNATNLISEISIARKLETTYHEILKTIHPHPTLSEGVHEATAAALNEAIHI